MCGDPANILRSGIMPHDQGVETAETNQPLPPPTMCRRTVCVLLVTSLDAILPEETFCRI